MKYLRIQKNELEELIYLIIFISINNSLPSYVNKPDLLEAMHQGAKGSGKLPPQTGKPHTRGNTTTNQNNNRSWSSRKMLSGMTEKQKPSTKKDQMPNKNKIPLSKFPFFLYFLFFLFCISVVF